MNTTEFLKFAILLFSATMSCAAFAFEPTRDALFHIERNKNAKIDAKIADVKADYHRRNEKLQEAWDLTREALGPDHSVAA